MVGCEWNKDFIDQQYMLKVVYNAFSIKKIHGCRKEVPIQRLRKSEVLRSAGNVGYGNNLLKGHDLNSGNDANHVYMAGKQCHEEASYHDKRPYRTCDKGLFLLFVVGERRGFGFVFCLMKQKKRVSASIHLAESACTHTPSDILLGAPELPRLLGVDGSDMSVDSSESSFASVLLMDRC